MTISQLPDVLAEKHDSLNLFSTEEDSAELIDKIVYISRYFFFFFGVKNYQRSTSTSV